MSASPSHGSAGHRRHPSALLARADIEAARGELLARGVEVSEVFHEGTAHGEHEKRTGEADPNWPDWYAEYMVRERAGEELPS